MCIKIRHLTFQKSKVPLHSAYNFSRLATNSVC
nr:MAG TPA: hypothetical protein [Caudoviricetes sp.]